MSVIDNTVINKAIEYILENIWNNVSVEDVADHCHMSKFYLGRVFKQQTGESLYTFIKRIKMEQSALKLKLEQDRSVTEIGMDYGYSSSNYSSAFSLYHNTSPTGFRRTVQERTRKEAEKFKEIDQKIKIVTMPDYLVMYERFIGNYSTMKTDWCRFVYKHTEEITEDTIFFERTFDDPTITDKDNCIYDICMGIEGHEGYENTCILKGGKFAVYPFRGYIQEIQPIHQELNSIWFPLSHHEIDARYAYEKYYKVESDGYMEFDVCIPIK